MFAVAGVPSDNDALEKDGPNVPIPTKQRQYEDCDFLDFLDDYDDESNKATRQGNSDEQDACRKKSS